MKARPSLSPPEEVLLEAWRWHLQAEGWRPQSATRAVNRVREMALAAPGGLLGATRANIYGLAERYEQRQGKAPGSDFNRSPGWRQSIATIRAFYRWGHSEGVRLGPLRILAVSLGPDPTTRLLLKPCKAPGVRLQPRDARHYQRVLACRGLSPRDEAMLRLLAMGLEPADVAALGLSDVNRDAPWTIRRRTGTWLPLSDRAVLSLFRWLQVRPTGRGDYLFPGRKRGSGISASSVRDTVRRATRLAFPRPTQAALRRSVYPAGFRHLFITRRFVHASHPPHCGL
jgi:integrase